MRMIRVMSERPARGGHGRGKGARSLALVGAARAILEEIHPATVRAVCYRLFIAGLIPSMEKKHVSAVGSQLVWARENGSVPWEYIVDEGRKVERISTWDNPAELIQAAVGQYRKAYWSAQPLRVEVWSEKGTVRGTVQPVLDEYGVAFRVFHGFGSATSVHDIAEYSNESEKPLVALYVGDWDPSGLCMSEVDLPKRFDRYSGRLSVVRIAIHKNDVIEDTSLPSFAVESKAKDSRSRWFRDNFGERCWELDAMSPVDLRDRVDSAIRKLIDEDAWQHALSVERAEQESLSQVLGAWQSICGQAQKYSPDVTDREGGTT